jgi:hypothetical protein
MFFYTFLYFTGFYKKKEKGHVFKELEIVVTVAWNILFAPAIVAIPTVLFFLTNDRFGELAAQRQIYRWSTCRSYYAGFSNLLMVEIVSGCYSPLAEWQPNWA